jgi:hypothetical protein
LLPSPDADLDQQAQLALLNSLVVTAQHFFGGFTSMFADVRDPRHPAYITYPLPVLLATGVLLPLLHLGARRQVQCWLRGNAASAAKFQALFGVDECPHGDTLNAAYRRLDVAEVQGVVTNLAAQLIRSKVLYPYRLLERYFLVVIDGTGVLVYPERHCPHCLTRTQGGQTTYYHPLLEAKLVTALGVVVSLMTEFIENPGEHPTKQDCELKAFYRLAERLHARFPQLPICLLLDGLYAGGPTFSRCERYGWKYLIVLQDGDLPSVHEEFAALCAYAPGMDLTRHVGGPTDLRQDFRWANDIAYVDTAHQAHTVAVIECWESERPPGVPPTRNKWLWITNFDVTPKNVSALANDGGRLRWKIENEGFNSQKCGGYAMEHAFSQNVTAGKVFYLLLQIGHLFFQLIEKGSLFRKAFPAGVGSLRNLARRLLEAWRNLRMSPEALQQLLARRVQIRFNTS